jgi:glutamate synthase domain-containing protein 2/NADPH-dependent glutamate synthase beta subunit-like oxidoreductase
MITIDLSTMSIRKANELIRGYGSTHQSVEIINPDARHYIGVGLISPIRVRIRGSAGYYCGGLTDGPHFQVEKNVSWGVGDNMFEGSIVVGGNAGAIAGEGLRGGEIVVKGNIGSRAAQVMKKGTLCCAGNANFMAGYMMYGGRLIILGDSGPRVGEDMMGGEIYIGGRVESLGSDAKLVDPEAGDTDSVMEFLDRYDLGFHGTLKKVVCAGRLLRYGTPEPRIRNLPFFTFSGGKVDYWNNKIQEDLQVKALIGRYRIRGYGAARHIPHFSDIGFKGDLSRIGTDPGVVSKINLRTFIGDKHGGKALDLSMPVVIAPMSFGALSPPMKTALGIASRLSGIAENTGEGGMYSLERAEARQMIAQCLAGRLGWNVHDMKRSDGVEIYISQGAKPGLGGQLMAEKLTKEIAAIRGIPAGMDLRSPSRHPDILGGDDLIMKVQEFREAVGWRVPVSIKLGAGRIRDDIKIALKDGLDFVELDGLQGGTGAAGSEVLEYVGIPTIAAIQEALDGLEEIDATGKLPVILMGGIKDGADAVKAIALGATAVGLGTSMLIAGGCISCMQCSVGTCVIGSATQDAGFVARYEPERRALQMHRFLEAFRWQMASIIHALGYSDVRQVSRKDLVALTPEAAALTRLPYKPDSRDRIRRQIEKKTKSRIAYDESLSKTQEAQELYDPYPDIQWIPAPCQKGCPVGTDVPSYVGLIWEEKFEEAFEAITANNPFSSVCGRVCAKPCEPDCRRGESDAPIAIRNLKRFVMDRIGHDFHSPPVLVNRPQTVGIVGGGPTGLTAAQDLAELGCEIHVYERADQLGGMMYVIPEFRLPRKVIEDDIKRLLAHCPGVKIHLNTELGVTVSLEDLKRRHDAVLLTIGLWQDRKLGIPGEIDGLEGLYGIDFLTRISSGSPVALHGRALVVGGGNVAMDVARTALRVGAAEVQLFCLEAREEMPAWKHEIEETEKEGILINPSWGPRQILHQNGRVTGVEFMRCVSVFDSQGRFRPVYDRDKTTAVEGETVLLAIGLQSVNPELHRLGLMARGFVKADFETMRTTDPKIFAAGDCAFGPSAIVHAMNHGHRASYYINAFLEGRKKPLPYSTPYRTRRVPVAQDPMWEKLPLEEQPFHGLGEDPAAFSECESTYDPETAKRQAARCLRCDAETGTSNYSRETREHIHAMARTEPGETEGLREILLERLKPRDNPFPPERPAHLDDLVFLSAALTRLVIDPYREECNTRTRIGQSVELRQPFLVTGFDDAPEEVRQALTRGLAATGCGYIGQRPLSTGPSDGERPWLQLVVDSDPDPEADGLIYRVGREFRSAHPKRLRKGQLLGLAVGTSALEKTIPFALENGYDLLLLDGSIGLERPWAELQGYPDLRVMRETIRLLRELNREEEIALIYFGGMRSGTDVAKALAINCNAVAFGVAAGIALGGVINGGGLEFDGGRSPEERCKAAENWIRATTEETAIIARCTGKTNVHNLEPEDMRSVTLSTSDAMGIPMASGKERRDGF